MKIKLELLQFIESIFLIFLVLLVLLPTSPLFLSHSFRDSGVFLYSGWRIINGEIPYLNFWDHKPPIIYFINALGLLIANNSVWGVWLIEFIAVFISAFIGYSLIKKMFGIFPALVSTLLWLMTLFFILDGGNITTEYTLPLQFITFYLIFNPKKFRKNFIKFFIIGITGGFAFYLKQTSIGLWLAIIIFLFFEFIFFKRKDTLLKLFFLFLGSLSVSMVIVGYFIINRAFFEFIDSVFIYNFFYSIEISDFGERLWNFLKFSHLSGTGLLQFGIIGIPLVFIMFKTKLSGKFENINSLFLIVLLDFLIELILINLPGKSYLHYYLTLLPSLALLASVPIYVLSSWINQQRINKSMTYLVYCLAMTLILLISIREYRIQLFYLQSNQANSIISFIKDNSDSSDYILLWGAEASVNFYSKRVSPSRYFYQYPLFKPGYTNEEKIEEFLDDIIRNKPKYIIDTNREEYPFLKFPIDNLVIGERSSEIKSIYKLLLIIDDWSIYMISN